MIQIATSKLKSFAIFDAKTDLILDKCSKILHKRPETRSIYCSRLDQWLSAKYCSVCGFSNAQEASV